MPRKSLADCLVAVASCLVAMGTATVTVAQPAPAYVYASPLLPLLVQTPENAWLQVSANAFSDVWTPPELEPLVGSGTPPPYKLISAWSGFAWDSNRGDLILYGGGHANYSGNDVYRWHSSTLRWERASLPSEIFEDPVSGFQAIDGVNAAPSSAHTYKNNTFLPIADRFLTWGGAAYNNGGAYLRVSETDPASTRPVGPYLFDPNRADGNKVGGTTGSHVMRDGPHPEIVGGLMWENRDIQLHLSGQTQPTNHVTGCAAYVAENGHDVVYTAGSEGGSTDLNLYRYQLTDLSNPALDQMAKVGMYWVGAAGNTTCGYDPLHKVFLRTDSNVSPFSFWDLNEAAPNNREQEVLLNTSIGNFQTWLVQQGLDIANCALEFDPRRNAFPLWCGAGTIWEVHSPAANTTDGWTMTQEPAPPNAVPPGETTGNGVLGKWRYASFYDVFVGLEDINEGHIWIYKPVGWVQPNPVGNTLPTVAITSPSNGDSVAPLTQLNVIASASDVDGNVARVELYVNGVDVGQATSPPYTFQLTPSLVGTYQLVAVAVDNVGGMKASSPVIVTVSAPLTTVVLQRALNGYAGAADTYLDTFNPTTSWGGASQLLLEQATYAPLVRFAVFQSEGGPVPNGAAIQSATLELYKQFYDDTLQLNALLKPWDEAEATWTVRQAGLAWTTSGASGAGTDYDAAADALVAGDFNPGWVAFDVTPRLQQWSTLSSTNYGWRLAQVGTNGNFKQFYSAEYSADPTLRPKLTVVYAGPGKANTSTTLVSSANPSMVGTSITFTATVGGSAPTGSVSFVDGAVSIASCSAVSLVGAGDTRTAQCATSSLTATTHSIVALYGGDANNNSSASAPLLQTVNPIPPLAPVVTGVFSRKTHGAAGTFDLALSLTSTNPTTEPRLGPVQTVVFKFDKPIASGAAAIASGTATINTITFAGNEMRIVMAGVDDQQYVTLAVTNVAAQDGGSGGNGTVRVGFLEGDVTQNRVVTLADEGMVNAALAQPVTASNYLMDVNASGTLTIADRAIVDTDLTRALPAP